MTTSQHEVPRRHWLIRYYRAQFRFQLRLLTTLRIVPPPVAAALFAWLRRTEIPKRGNEVKQPIRSKIAIPVLVVLGVLALVLMLVLRWQSPDHKSGTPTSEGTVVPEQSAGQLSAWQAPTTTNPDLFATAYARAIWTYDTTQHSYANWQNAVSLFAGRTGPAPQVAMSLLPLWSEWSQLQLRKAHATVRAVTAETTPELRVLEDRPDKPIGWHAFVVHGMQTVVLDTDTQVVGRQVAVSVVCAPTCEFWSASAEVSP